MKSKFLHYFIIVTFVALYAIVSTLSTIHVIDFFSLSNNNTLAICLAIAFEIGAAASLASIIVMDKMNKAIVWALFFILTAMQAMGNAYYAYVHLHDFQGWVELFGLVDEELITQKRILSIISGAILPLVSLGFIKALVDYMRPAKVENTPSSADVPVVDQPNTPSLPPSLTPSLTGSATVENPLSEVVKEETKVVEINEPAVQSEVVVGETEKVEVAPVEEKTIPQETSVLDKIKVFKSNGN
jgi:hypothetical protein